jgi:hypothetical protein
MVEQRLERVVSRSFGASIQVVPDAGRRFIARSLPLDGTSSSEQAPGAITRGLLILKEPLDQILDGSKIWEIRGKATTLRGPIALIESKSGHVVGTCSLEGVVGPLSLADLRANAAITGFLPDALPYPTTYGWVLASARRLPKPVPYRHPMGAVIWVKLDPSVVRQLAQR